MRVCATDFSFVIVENKLWLIEFHMRLMQRPFDDSETWDAFFYAQTRWIIHTGLIHLCLHMFTHLQDSAFRSKQL